MSEWQVGANVRISVQFLKQDLFSAFSDRWRKDLSYPLVFQKHAKTQFPK